MGNNQGKGSEPQLDKKELYNQIAEILIEGYLEAKGIDINDPNFDISQLSDIFDISEIQNNISARLTTLFLKKGLGLEKGPNTDYSQILTPEIISKISKELVKKIEITPDSLEQIIQEVAKKIDPTSLKAEAINQIKNEFGLSAQDLMKLYPRVLGDVVDYIVELNKYNQLPFWKKLFAKKPQLKLKEIILGKIDINPEGLEGGYKSEDGDITKKPEMDKNYGLFIWLSKTNYEQLLRLGKPNLAIIPIGKERIEAEVRYLGDCAVVHTNIIYQGEKVKIRDIEYGFKI